MSRSLLVLRLVAVLVLQPDLVAAGPMFADTPRLRPAASSSADGLRLQRAGLALPVGEQVQISLSFRNPKPFASPLPDALREDRKDRTSGHRALKLGVNVTW